MSWVRNKLTKTIGYHNWYHNLYIRLKKVVLFPELARVKTFLSLTGPHSRMCIRIYIFKFKKVKPKITRRKKTKET